MSRTILVLALVLFVSVNSLSEKSQKFFDSLSKESQEHLLKFGRQTNKWSAADRETVSAAYAVGHFLDQKSTVELVRELYEESVAQASSDEQKETKNTRF